MCARGQLILSAAGLASGWLAGRLAPAGAAGICQAIGG
jgi:hypothetical protein